MLYWRSAYDGKQGLGNGNGKVDEKRIIGTK